MPSPTSPTSPTLAELLALPAGQELDQYVAENICAEAWEREEWKRYVPGSGAFFTPKRWCVTHGTINEDGSISKHYYSDPPPPVSSDIRVAFALEAVMAANDYEFDLKRLKVTGSADLWGALFWKVRRIPSPGRCWYRDKAEAIVRAALAAWWEQNK